MNYLKDDNQLINWAQNPFLRLVGLLIIGILIGNFWDFSPGLLAVVLTINLVAAAVFFLKFKQNHRYFKWSGILMFLSVVVLGSFVISWHKVINDKYHYALHIEKDNRLIVQIVEPLKKKKSISTCVKVEQINGKSARGKLLLYFKKSENPKYDIGDYVEINTRISKIKRNSNPKAFDYGQYLYYKGISYNAFVQESKHTFISKGRVFLPFHIANQIRSWALKVFEKRIEDVDQRAIASAMVLGYKENLSEAVYKAFSETGAVHVLAVSGLHVGIITMIFIFLFGFIKTESKKIKSAKFLVLVFITFAYAFITGASPAVLRAALMFSLFIMGKYFFHNSFTYNLLALSAFILLIINPNYLFDAGFQFSYLAILSILYFQPKISTIWSPTSSVMYNLWNLITVSMAAQILIFPISIFYFHKFPLYFIFSGVITVFLAFYILALGLILLCTYYIPFIGDVVSEIYSYLLYFFLYSVKTIQRLPFHTLEDISISKSTLFLIYGLIFSLMLYYSGKRSGINKLTKIGNARIRIGKITLLCSVLGLCVNMILSAMQIKSNSELVIYDSRNATLVDIFIGDQLYEIKSDNFSEKNIGFIAEGNRLSKGVDNVVDLSSFAAYSTNKLTVKDSILYYNNNIILFLKNIDINKPFADQSDILILSHGVDLFPYDFLANHSPEQVVIDNSVSYEVANRWSAECRKKNIPIHNIKKDGVFIR